MLAECYTRKKNLNICTLLMYGTMIQVANLKYKQVHTHTHKPRLIDAHKNLNVALNAFIWTGLKITFRCRYVKWNCEDMDQKVAIQYTSITIHTCI